MKMKKRMVFLLLALALCLLPLTASAAGEVTEETTFQVYAYNSEGTYTTGIGSTIDLNQPLYIERTNANMSSFCLWKCAGSAIPPDNLQADADMSDGLYPLVYSNKIILDDNTRIAGSFDSSNNATSGLTLQFNAGGNTKAYVPAGTYRFVSIWGSSGDVKYSPVFTITDSTGLSTLCAPTFYTGKDPDTGAFTGSTATLTKDATMYLHIADFAPALSTEAASQILLLDASSGGTGKYLLWDSGSHNNGTLTDKKENNVQILDELTVEGWAMSGNSVQGSFAMPISTGTYRLAVVVSDKTYVSPGVFTVANAPAPGIPPNVRHRSGFPKRSIRKGNNLALFSPENRK